MDKDTKIELFKILGMVIVLIVLILGIVFMTKTNNKKYDSNNIEITETTQENDENSSTEENDINEKTEEQDNNENN